MAFSKLTAKPSSKPLFSLVWEDIKRPFHIGFRLIVLYKLISTIQVLGLLLEIAMQFFANTTGKWDLISIPRTFTFYKRFNFEAYDTIATVAFVICVLVVMVNYGLIVNAFLVAKLGTRKLINFSVFLQHYMIAHQFVFFLPIHTFMLEVIKHSDLDRINLFTDNSHNVLFLSLSIIVLVLNFALGLLNLRCYSSLYAQKTFTKRNSYLAFSDIIFKSFLAVYLTFVPSTTYGKWIIICFSIIYMMIVYYFFHTQLPFFQIKVLETYCFFLGAKIAMCLSIFLTGIFDEFRTVNVPDLPLSAFLLSLPVCVMGQSYKMIRTIQHSITFEENNYRTENDVFIHILAIRYVFKKGANVSIKLSKTESTAWNMQLNGIVTRHHDRCEKNSCPCKTFLEIEETHKGIGLKREKYKELEIVLMRDLYEQGVEKLATSELILLNLAQFYLLYLENYLRSYLVLQAFEKKANKSFETEILIEYLKKRVQERMQLKLSGNDQQELIGDYKPDNLNVTELVQNELQFIQLKKLIQDQLGRQLRFWDLIDNFEMNSQSIENCCEEVDIIRTKIEKIWDGLSKINQKCSTHYLLYGLYQALVNNTTKRGERYLNDYNRMHGINDQEREGITNDNLYDTQTVIIKISMRRDKIGMVEETSGDVDSLFGYQGSELIDTNVATIMSSFFKERHHTFVMNHFEKGTENVLNKAKRLFGYHREGYIFPIFLYVSIYPNVETGLSYMGIIRPRKVYNNYILVKSDGSVDSYSPEVAEYLGLESRKKYNISEICPEFEKINSAFNYIARTKYDNLKDDIVEYRQDSNNKRSNEYFVKVSNASAPSNPESQKALPEPLLMPFKKEIATLNSDMEESSKAVGSMETKDEPALMRTKDSKDSKDRERDRGGLRSVAKIKNMQKKLRRLNSEDIDEYKKVYEQFSINGSILSFAPQREKMDASIKNFLCTVSDEIFDYSILRIITLGRNDENLEVDKDADKTKITTVKGFEQSEFTHKKSIALEKEILLTTEQDDAGISSMPDIRGQQVFRNPFGAETPDQQSPHRENQDEMCLPLKEDVDVSENQAQYSTMRNEFAESKVHTLGEKGSIKESDYGAQDKQELGMDFYDSRDFVQEMLHKGVSGDKGDLSSGYLSMKGGDMSKFEALLYKREDGKISNKLKSYFAIITACFAMAILNTIITNSSLEQGSQKVQKLLYIGQRINVMLNMNFNSRMIYLYLNGHITDTRHLDDQGIANYPQLCLTRLKTQAEDLLKLNTAVMNDIYDLHESSQPKLFSTTVTLEYPTQAMSDHNVKRLNTFEAIDTISLSALEIASQQLATVSEREEDISYILLNSMNQIYTGLQSGYTVYEEDLEIALSGTKSTTWGIAIAVLVVYVLFLIVLVRDMTSNHQDKIRFWNSLTKLDIVKGAGHKKMLMIMKENFDTSSNYLLLKRALMETKRQELKELKATKAKESQSIGFKRLKSYKLTNKGYFMVFPFIIVLAMILAFFIVSEVLTTEQMDNKRLYMKEIMQSETYYELNIQTLNGIYEYISEGATTQLRNKAIEQALEENMDMLSNLANFLNGFQTKSSFNPKDFIQMNICNIYDSAELKATCTRDAEGINLQGLASVLTFAKETMASLIDFTKNSDRSVNSIRTGLRMSNLLKLEVEMSYITDMFKILSHSLADSELDEQDTFRATQIAIVIGFIVVLSVLSYFTVWKGFKKLEGRKFDNMKILRVIPTFMILESKMLKTYLQKAFKDDLSSITNKL